jgi:hypothetical protein
MAVSTVERSTTAPATEKEAPAPPLNNGDRLTRAEFERIYAAHPEIKKAELIEGVVYMPSPARYREHGKPHGLWLQPDALLAGDLSRVLETLQQGLASQEHKAFCAALERSGKEAK